MKQNFKIIFCVSLVFLFSFLSLGIFLESYSQGLFTSEKNIVSVGGITTQNPKQVTLDVLQNILNDSQTDYVTINSLGFRGEEFTEMKPNNTFRIFLLGGSQMFGTGATSDDTTIPGYLDDYIEEQNHSFSIEVINSGLKGVDSRKELLLLQNMLINFNPDLIIIYDGLNDLRAGNSSKQLLENWNLVCELGHKNNFDVIISLQPIAGFGDKSLTSDELSYVKNAKDFKNNRLIDSVKQYEMYAQNLQKLKNCTDTIDLRYVFDDELDSVYIDEAHVSDKGNSIVAKSLLTNISPNITKDVETIDPGNYKIDTTNSIISSELEYAIGTLFSNFIKKLTDTPFSTYENSSISSETTKEFEKIVANTQSLVYEDTEIEIMIEILSKNKFIEDGKIKIVTIDKNKGSVIQNVTYLMTITKDDNELFTNYFFAEDELIIQIEKNDDKNIKISGERKYELDALYMNPEIPISISGTFFESNSNYRFDISLRTIHDSENFIFLNGFYSEITT